MRPKERRETGEQDLFRSRLDQIIDLDHGLARLAKAIDWRFLEARCGDVYSDTPGHPPLPTRLDTSNNRSSGLRDLWPLKGKLAAASWPSPSESLGRLSWLLRGLQRQAKAARSMSQTARFML
jgi:hypothetical protein